MENEINRALNLEIDISGVSEQSLQVSSLFENLEQAAAEAAAAIKRSLGVIRNTSCFGVIIYIIISKEKAFLKGDEAIK